MQTVLLIDGENFKGKIKAVFGASRKGKPAWHLYDFKGLLGKVLQGLKIDATIFYFARIKEHPDSRVKSKLLIEEQRLLKTHLERMGYSVALTGRVRGHLEDDGKGKKILVFKEKGVDVKMAVDMVTYACEKKAKTIIMGSSDSDLQPAIAEVRSRKVECIYLGFEAQPNKGISYTTSRTILIRNSEILEFEKVQGRLI